MAELSPSSPDPLDRSPLFEGLSSTEREKVISSAQLVWFEAGEVIVRQGDPSRDLYVLGAGEAEVLADAEGLAEHHFETIGPGDVVGEMGVLDDTPRSATVRALVRTRALSIEPEQLLRHGANSDDPWATVHRNLARLVVGRMRTANRRGLAEARARLEEARLRAQFGIFFSVLLVLTVGYLFAVKVAATLLPSTWSSTVVSAPVIAVYALGCAFAVRRMGLPPHAFGMTWVGARQHVRSALAISLGVILLMTVVKALAVAAIPHLGPVFPISDLRGASILEILAKLGAYVVLIPLQEFVFRGAIQGSLLHLLDGSGRRRNALLLANAVYAAGHMHMGIVLVPATFSVGLLWGWMFDVQRSLVGVVASHLVIGCYALFVLL
ncbi:MAG: cyclic nucleotide-binding domain-containing protein [Myxococcota bacterium]